MCCLNCASTGSKRPKRCAKEDSSDDDDDDEADVPLPEIRVKTTTEEFYEQHKKKVWLSSFMHLCFHARSYPHAVMLLYSCFVVQFFLTLVRLL